jgi:hypothetical protein
MYKGWARNPALAPRPSMIYCALTRGWAFRLQLLLVLASAVILRFESRGTHDHILLPQIRDSPNLEGQVPIFISPRDKVTQLYPQALGSLFVASYDTQGYSEGILSRLHAGYSQKMDLFICHQFPPFSHSQRGSLLKVTSPV